MAAAVSETMYTWKQVEEHNKEGDAWVVISNKVYDISNFKHPGGWKPLSPYLGKDGTDRFFKIHLQPDTNLKTLSKFCIGRLAPSELKISIPENESPGASASKGYLGTFW